MSARNDKPFVAVDCGALPGELAASELFGHVKGSFTGATRDKPGQFEMAKGGTLMLDEIGNLSYENQIKLLRVLQERKIRRLGADSDITIDVRILAATNEDLRKAVTEGKFRLDLYYRLNEFKIELPPLRERTADFEAFAIYFMNSANKQLGKSVKGFTADAMDKMKAYAWHGNLRELKNVVTRATLLTTDETIDALVLPEEITDPMFSPEPISSNGTPLGIFGSLKEVVEHAEKNAIKHALKSSRFNKTKTAEVLEIDRKTLYNKMAQYGIDPSTGVELI
jgi:two-component system response regulator HydG